MTALVEVQAPATTPTYVPRGALHTLVRKPMGAIGIAMLLVAVAVAILAPFIAPYDPYKNNPATTPEFGAPCAGGTSGSAVDNTLTPATGGMGR